MARFGFVGAAYKSQSLNTDAQSCMNWYPEPDESGAGKSKVSLYPTGGLKRFSTLPNETSVPGLFAINGRLFAAASNLYEIFPDGSFNLIHSLATSANTASMSANQTQLLITTGGRVFVYDLLAATFTEATGLQGPVLMAGYGSGYFVAVLQDTNKFQFTLGDGTTWDPLDIAEIEGYPDNISSLLVDHGEFWFYGLQRTVVYGATTDPDNPLQPIPGAFIEEGCAASFSPVRLDNSNFWIGADERGQGIAWRAQGYTPQRVSTYAIENEWAGYPTISDAIAYPFQDRGHSFWQIYFPTANKTWVYDAGTGLWHERGYFSNGSYSAQRSECHASAFGKHLVGDWMSGAIFEMSPNILDDDGQLIRRFRRAPHISNEQQWIIHNQIQVDLQVGLAPSPLLDGFGNPREPQAVLRWSDDAAQTWSDEYAVGYGFAGEYKKRVMFRRLGRSRDRIYEFSVSDPIPWRVTDAYLQVNGG